MILEKNIVYGTIGRFHHEYHLNNKEKELSISKSRRYIFRRNSISLYNRLNWGMEYNNFKRRIDYINHDTSRE